MSDLDATSSLLHGRGGAYEMSRRPGLRPLVAEARVAGWSVTVLDGRAITSKATLLNTIAQRLRFPAWFGGNWDALADCLADAHAARLAAGTRGLCLVWDAADALIATDPEAARTFADICRETSVEPTSASAHGAVVGAVSPLLLIRSRRPVKSVIGP